MTESQVGWWLIASNLEAGEEGFSACIVRSDTGWQIAASLEARRLGIHPEGQVTYTPLRPDRLPGPEWRDRRLDAGEVIKLGEQARQQWRR